MDTHNSTGRSSFWEAYRACAEENRVRADRSPLYVRWVKDFESFLQGKPLRDRSRKDIEAFLSNLRKQQSIGAGTVGTCQCHHHHDLHACTEQARTFSQDPGGHLKKGKNNNILWASGSIQPRSRYHAKTLSKKDTLVKIFKY